MQAVPLPYLLVQQVFELFAGGQRNQRQGILGADFVNQKIEILLGKGMHQGGRLRKLQDAVQRFLRRHRQQLGPRFHECLAAVFMDIGRCQFVRHDGYPFPLRLRRGLLENDIAILTALRPALRCGVSAAASTVLGIAISVQKMK